jgi:hypothetical protein
MSSISTTALHEELDRYIDRFLLAEGWRVTGVDRVSTPGLVAVTMTRTSETGEQSVTRSATSAGEATFMACSSARRLVSPAADTDA